MSMMKKFNNLFSVDDEYEDEIEEVEEEKLEQRQQRVMKKENVVSNTKTTNIQTQKANNVILTEPLVFADSKDIVDDIKKNKVVIINLSKLDIETSDRLLDFISGGIYALNARLKMIGEDIYLCVPNGVEVTGDFYEGEY